MSLLTGRAPHVVEAQLRELVRNGRGATELEPVGERLLVRCAVQSVREWSTEEEQRQFGLQVLDMRRLFARTWPGDVNTLVYYEGDEYESVGAPQKNSMSRATAHYAIVLRLRKRDG